MSTVIRAKNGQLPPEAVSDIVKLLHGGGVGILPFDTVYGLVSKAFHHEAYEHLNQIKGQRIIPFVVVCKSVAALRDWYGGFDFAREKVISNLLPGPVSLILPFKKGISEDFLYPKHGFGVRVCSEGILGDVIAEFDRPLWATSTNRHGEHPPFTFQDILPAIIDEVDFAVDSGPTAFRQATSVVDLRSRPFTIQREGPWVNRISRVLSETEKPLEVLVVCTGNTCRSPLAERLLQHALGRPEESGIRVTSAGTSAPPGNLAAPQMAAIGKSWGVDLSDHVARELDFDMIETADLILVMEPYHAQIIQANFLIDPDKIRLFGELVGESEISDPYGLTEIHFQTTATMLRNAAEKWRDYFLAGIPRLKDAVEPSGAVR